MKTEQIKDKLWKLKNEYQFNHSLVSIGYPKVNRFNLTVEPPWRDFTEDECIKIKLTSAGVIPLVLLGDKGGVLLVKVIDENEANRWEIPSGGVKDEDEDILDTAIRELREETGISAKKDDLTPLTYARHGDRGGIQFTLGIDRADLPPSTYVDGRGRQHLNPPSKTMEDEIASLVIEPFEVFFDQKSSMLRFSHHPWSTKRIRGSLKQKARMVEVFYPKL